MYDLTFIGSVVKDLILLTGRGKVFKTPKDKLAPEWLGFEIGEKICVSELQECLGGVAADVAIGTKKIGLNSTVISTLGSDYKWLMSELRKNKIDTSFVAIDKKRWTSSVILVDKNTGERVIFYNKTSGGIIIDKIEKVQSKWFVVSSLTGKWKKQADKVISVIKKRGSGLILLPSTSQIRDDFPDLKKLLKFSKILILNRNEALEVASKAKSVAKSIRDLFKLLHNFGPEVVLITDGIKGAWASDGKKIQHSPIEKVKAVDTTGAGDAFASGFLGFFLKGKSLKESLEAGIKNSASVVQYIGTTRGLLSHKDILKFRP